MDWVDIIFIAYLIYENYKTEKELEYWKNKYWLEAMK